MKLLISLLLSSTVIIGLVFAVQPGQNQRPAAKAKPRDDAKPLADAVEEVQTPRKVEAKRPEQKLGKHDVSDAFAADKASASSRDFKGQPDDGFPQGFDFFRHPLNASQPKESPKKSSCQRNRRSRTS